MTPADAQRVQGDARAAGRWPMWFVAERDGRFIAWAVIADPHGRSRAPGELAADTWTNCARCCPPA